MQKTTRNEAPVDLGLFRAQVPDDYLAWLREHIINCGWCGREFLAETSHHQYCRRSHQVMAAQKKAKIREGEQANGSTP